MATISCSSPVSNVKNNLNVIIIDGSTGCVPLDYKMPPMPNVLDASSDKEIVDMLVEHIKVLRTDILKMKGTNCLQ